MNREQRNVLEFHKAIGHRYALRPTTDIPGEDMNLRMRLIEEECDELYQAMYMGDLVEIADALGDILYVVYGCGLAYGIDLEPIFQEIHCSNMAKVGGPVKNGKQLKPEGWQPPRIWAILDCLAERNIS